MGPAPVTGRHPALGDEPVERLRSFVAGAPPVARRAAGAASRPVRRAVHRLLDPALRATLDQIRAEAAAGRATTAGADRAATEVLRAELLAMQGSLDALAAGVERLEARLDALSSPDRPSGPRT